MPATLQQSEISGFNPRPREGSDAAPWSMRQRGYSVSIRAPAKGAILVLGSVRPLDHRFNPRPREGSDLTQSQLYSPNDCFNPAPPAKGAICANPSP